MGPGGRPELPDSEVGSGWGRRLAVVWEPGVCFQNPDCCAPPPSPTEPGGVSGLLGNKGPGDQQREAQGQEMGTSVLWLTVLFADVICGVNTF